MNPKLTWERPGQDEERFRRYLILALARSGVCVLLEDARSNYLFIANLLDAWTVAPDEVPDDNRLFGTALAASLGTLKASVRRSGEPGQIEAAIGADRHFRFIVETVPEPVDGVELMTTVIEVSEERRRETVLRTLLREVSHRSKNLLAIIQSIAAQTARHSDTIEQFLHKFRGRLYSLSLSQDLVTNSLWRGAHFRNLVHEQLLRYLPEGSSAVELTGDDVILNPNAALHIGLALHELIINAVTHGALVSRRSGITVSCAIAPGGEADLVEFVWREERVPNVGDGVTLRPTPHFGSAVLERVLPASVDGEAVFEIGATHVLYRLRFPLKPDVLSSEPN